VAYDISVSLRFKQSKNFCHSNAWQCFRQGRWWIKNYIHKWATCFKAFPIILLPILIKWWCLCNISSSTKRTGLDPKSAQYTLSIITPQPPCFQLRTTLKERIYHGLCTKKQNILLLHMHGKNGFWPINMVISINTKTRHHVMTWSLVFVLKLISTFIGQRKELFFMHVLKKDVLLLCA
jgi:hypothetical protein